MFQIIQTSNSANPLPVLVVANRPPAQEGAIKKIEDGTAHGVLCTWRVFLAWPQRFPRSAEPAVGWPSGDVLALRSSAIFVVLILLYF